MAAPIAISDFKTNFARDFVYGSTNDKVLDADITKAINEALMVWNSTLWANTSEQQLSFLYLTAHFLVIDIQNAGGLSTNNTSAGMNSRGTGLINSKSVGSVSVSSTYNTRLINDPVLWQLNKTGYGQKYLQMLTPRIVAPCFSVAGGVNP